MTRLPDFVTLIGMKKTTKKKTAKKRPAKKDFSQSVLSGIEKIIGGKLGDGIGKPKK